MLEQAKIKFLTDYWTVICVSVGRVGAHDVCLDDGMVQIAVACKRTLDRAQPALRDEDCASIIAKSCVRASNVLYRLFVPVSLQIFSKPSRLIGGLLHLCKYCCKIVHKLGSCFVWICVVSILARILTLLKVPVS